MSLTPGVKRSALLYVNDFVVTKYQVSCNVEKSMRVYSK